jgi:outer membrane protein assembly factor BamB
MVPAHCLQALTAVIPTIIVYGPLALLAMLFPVLFAGLALWLRRWLVLFVIASLDSMLFLVRAWVGPRQDSWWGSQMAWWGLLAATGLAGFAWSWVRQKGAQVPRGSILHLEGITLAGFTCLCLGLAVVSRPRQLDAEVRVRWLFEATERGAIVSSPVVEGDHIYCALVRDTGLGARGAVYCLDRRTGAVRWKFDDLSKMLQTYCTPCVDKDRLYIGDGMHADYSCTFYCLEAASGRKLWEFSTADHIESSPCVAQERVFFGAGDDGLYALDTSAGHPCWHYRPDLHIDASPTVSGRFLYAGSGVSRRYRTTSIFCLDTGNGEVVWSRPTDLPAWGSPIVSDEEVLFGLGNGRLDENPPNPAGALLCVNGRTGQKVWSFTTDNALLARPVIDRGRVYFGTRGGTCYCLDRGTGRLLWERTIGSPVVTRTPVAGEHVYVAASGGQLARLQASNGTLDWTFDLAAYSQTRPRLWSSPAVVAAEQDGHNAIYLGTELRSPINSAAVLYCLEELTR